MFLSEIISCHLQSQSRSDGCVMCNIDKSLVQFLSLNVLNHITAT